MKKLTEPQVYALEHMPVGVWFNPLDLYYVIRRREFICRLLEREGYLESRLDPKDHHLYARIQFRFVPEAPFWGQRETSSKGTRHNTRLIWHYFRWYETWARGTGFFTACRAGWPDSETFTLAKQREKPTSKECCGDCRRIFNQNYREAAVG